MYRRLILPLTALFALVALFAVVMPTGATGEERHFTRDTYVFGHDATFAEPIDGSVQVYSGDVTVANRIAGDLLVVGGTVTFRGAGRVDGDLIYGASRSSARTIGSAGTSTPSLPSKGPRRR